MQDIFDRIETKVKIPEGDIFDRISAKPAQPAAPAEPNLLQGFASEAWKNTKRLASTIMDTTGGDPNIQQFGFPRADELMGNASVGGAAAQAAKNLPQLLKASPAAETAVAVKNAATSGVKALIEFPRNPVRAMTQALKPLATNAGFTPALDRALPEIKAVEPDLGKPIQGVEDLQAAIKIAKKKVWSQYEKILGPQAQRGIDASPIADAIDASIPAKLKLQNPQAAAKIMDLANTYRRTFTVAQLDDFLGTSNAELSSYYGKYPAAKITAQNANPDIAANVAEANTLRKTIAEALDAPGGGQAVREIKQRYGALMNVEKEAQRRLNVAARQNPDSLSEQLSRWSAAMKVGKAVVTFPARPLGALGDVASAMAGRTMATALKEANSSDALIANVFKHYSIQPAPIQFTPIVPKGLLGQGAIVTPPPADTSTVTGIPAQPAKRILMIPEQAGSPMVTPPPKESMREFLKRTGRKR